MQHNPITDLDLDEIASRAAHLYEYVNVTDEAAQPDFDQLTDSDVPALVEALRQARSRIAALEGEKPALCGRTRDISGTEYGPCTRKAGHQEAYCRSGRGASYFLAVAADQPPVTSASAVAVSGGEQ